MRADYLEIFISSAFPSVSNDETFGKGKAHQCAHWLVELLKKAGLEASSFRRPSSGVWAKNTHQGAPHRDDLGHYDSPPDPLEIVESPPLAGPERWVTFRAG